MPATSAQMAMFRADLGDTDESVFSDTEIDTIWDRATAESAAANDDLIFIGAKIIGVKQLYAQAIKRVDYTAGQSSAKLSQYTKGLRDMLKDLQAEQDSIKKRLSSPIRQLGVRRIPREKSVP